MLKLKYSFEIVMQFLIRILYRRIGLFFGLLITCMQGFAQYGQLQFTNLDVNDGLSHNQVNCILKDNRGFLWFGTLSGLNRYDGYSFKVFRHDNQDSTSLSDNFITGIFKLPDNKLWINTRSGANIYNPVSETFKPQLYSLSVLFIFTLRNCECNYYGWSG